MKVSVDSVLSSANCLLLYMMTYIHYVLLEGH